MNKTPKQKLKRKKLKKINNTNYVYMSIKLLNFIRFSLTLSNKYIF